MEKSLIYSGHQKEELFQLAGYKEVRYKDHDALFSFLSDYLCECLIGGKMVTIIPNEKYRENLNRFLESHYLSRFTFLNPSDWKKIGNTTPSPDLKELSDNYNSCLIRHHKIQKRSKSILDSVNAEVFGSRTLGELITYLALHSEQEEIKIFPGVDFEFSLSEFQLLKQFLLETKNLLKSFESVEAIINQSHKIALTEDELDHLEEKMKALIQLRTEVHRLISEYHNSFQDLQTSWETTYQNEYLLLVVRISDYEEELTSYLLKHGPEEAKKPSILHFDPKTKIKYEDWLKLVAKADQLVLHCNSLDWFLKKMSVVYVPEDLQSLPVRLYNYLESYKTITQKIISNRLDRVNPINADHAGFRILYERLEVCINQYKQFAGGIEKIEINTNSSLRQLKICINLHQKITALCKSLSVYPEVHKWNALSMKLNSEQWRFCTEILNQNPENWDTLLERYYLTCLQERALNPSINHLEDSFSNTVVTYRKALGIRKEFTSAMGDKLISDNLKRLQVSNPKLYRKVVKKETLTEIESNEVRYLLPIHCSNVRSGKTEVLLEIKDDVVTITHAEDSINESVFVKPFAIDHLVPDIDHALKNFPSTMQLSKAKNLADSILSCTSDLRLFQLKSANVISLASDELNNFFLDSLFDKGIKETQTNGRLFDALVESILETNRNQYLICENGMIDQNQSNDVLWQRLLLEKLEISGFEVISIPSWDLSKKGKLLLHEISNKILGNAPENNLAELIKEVSSTH